MAKTSKRTAGTAASSARSGSGGLPAIRTRMNKIEIVRQLARQTDLSQRQVEDLLKALESLVERSLRKGAAGEFVLPRLLRIQAVDVNAREARVGRNPKTGAAVQVPPKPASRAVRIRPGAVLKRMVV